jgi:hypothetical protein
MRAFFAVVVGIGVMLAVAIAMKDRAQPEKKLWAAISVSHPILELGSTGDRFRITFALVNDGDKVVDLEILSSQLLVNGEELKDWPMIVSNGPRDERWGALPAEDDLVFSYALGDYFKAAGIYRVSWKGKGFQTTEVVFRVLDKTK